MECKGICNFIARKSCESINRNIVECKDGLEPQENGVQDVLIETLWNVKMLIRDVIGVAFAGINRNIVECKARKRWYAVFRRDGY